MALVRALVTVFDKGILYKAGDTFEYEGTLTDPNVDGIELVTKKTTLEYDKKTLAEKQALIDNVEALKARWVDLQTQLSADPSRADLVQQVLDAESVYDEALKSLNVSA